MYSRTASVNAAPGGDSVKQAVLDLDTDLNGAFAAVNAHEALTATHGATGAIVGTTNVQTLTNKTLTAPLINEAVALTATASQLNQINLKALATDIVAILAGTGGFEAGNALKLGGGLASSFWNNANCTKSLASSGWQKLASGLIIQWADFVNIPVAGLLITLPTAFTSVAYIVAPISVDAGYPVSYVFTRSSISQMTLKSSNASVSINTAWLAIGY